MAANEIHKNDIGTIIEVTVQDDTVAVDISTATAKEFIFVKPSGAKVTVTASFSTSGVDGKLRYTTVSGDFFDETGSWRLQVRVVLPTGAWRSDITIFDVYANL